MATCDSVGNAETLVFGAGDVLKVAVEVIVSRAAASSSRRVLHDRQNEAIEEANSQDFTFTISHQD